MKNLLFGGHEISKPLDFVMMLLRGFVGLTMFYLHGMGKIYSSETGFGATKLIEASKALPLVNRAPEFFGWSGTLGEALFPLLLAVGLLTRFSALMLVGTMWVAAFLAHRADPFEKRELALLYLFASLVFVIYGSGRFGLDAAIRGKGRTPAA